MKPTPTPTPAPVSTSHYMATRLDVIAAAMYAERISRPNAMMSMFGGGMSTRGEILAMAYADATSDLAELDRLQSEKEKP